MGINTGFCTVGNFGSQDRMDYTIIGGAVNLAARLGVGCCAGDDPHCARNVDPRAGRHRGQGDASISVKGFAQSLHAYEVMGLRDLLPRRVIRRNIDGVRITIELGHDDSEQTIHVLREIIGEIDHRMAV